MLTAGIPLAGATVTYGYNTQGRLSGTNYAMKFPDTHISLPFGTMGFTYGFDTMGRPASMTDIVYSGYDPDDGIQGNYTQWVKNVQYDYASRMTSMQSLTGITDDGFGNVSRSYSTQSMTYNVNGQLASLGWAGGAVTGTIQYVYSATQNNGQITQAVDGVSGETIAYQYDALKRLVSASSTPNTGSSPAAWSETYTYDGFGNLTGKSLNSTNPGVSAATNQLAGASYDANGNLTAGVTGQLTGGAFTYDMTNRMVSAQESNGGIEYFGYSPDNKQVYRKMSTGNEEFTLYGGSGEKLIVYSPSALLRSYVYFSGKMIWAENAAVYLDRLGTNRASGARFRPYGNEITSTSNEREKFATYTRDGYTGLDYADQRYYASTYGRFNTVDPAGKSAILTNPLSWNRYTYTLGDPINGSDPTGLCDDGDAMADGGYGYSIGEVPCSVLGIVDSGTVSDDGNVTFSVTGTASAANPATLTSAIGNALSSAVNAFGSFMNAASNNPFVQAGATLASVVPALETGDLAPVEEGLEGAEAAAVDVGTTVYRVFGNLAGQFGRFWTTLNPTTVFQLCERSRTS